MSESNGKWQVAFWVITFLVVGSFAWTTSCYLTNQYRIESNMNRLEILRDLANDTMHRIDKRLSRIEFKLGIEDSDYQK